MQFTEAQTSHRRGEQGFTFTEALIVVAIIALMSAIFIPTYLRQVDNARDAAVRSGVREIELGLRCYELDHDGTYPAAVTNPSGSAPLVDDSGKAYLAPWPDNPWTGKPMQQSARYDRGGFSYQAEDATASSAARTSGGARSYALVGWLTNRERPLVAAAPAGGSPVAALQE